MHRYYINFVWSQYSIWCNIQCCKASVVTLIGCMYEWWNRHRACTNICQRTRVGGIFPLTSCTQDFISLRFCVRYADSAYLIVKYCLLLQDCTLINTRLLYLIEYQITLKLIQTRISVIKRFVSTGWKFGFRELCCMLRWKIAIRAGADGVRNVLISIKFLPCCRSWRFELIRPESADRND